MLDHDSIRIDDHKLAFHPREVARWLDASDSWEGLRALYPLYVEISPFGGCNFRCSFCAKDFLKYENNRIDKELLKRTLTIMGRKGVKSVLFAGEGEPTLYRDLGEVIEHCRVAGVDSALNTNGAVSHHQALEAAAASCRWIRFSVNAGDAATHAEIHGCREGVFDRVLENMAYAVEKKREHASPCTIGAQAVLLPENQSGLVELARRCREIGVDYLSIKPYSQHPESLTRKYEGVEYSELDELTSRLLAEQRPGFQVYCRPNTFARARMSSHGYKRCLSVPSFWAYIRSNGDVFGCSNFMTDKRFRYGNLNEAELDEIWEGPRRKAALEYMKSHDISQCRVNCRMDKVNQYLWELRNPPAHVNFI